MSDNGVLQNILNYLGGPNNLIPFFPKDLIERATSYPYFKDISGGFLAHVLSYTDLKDTMSVILTCKSWYLASRAESFWSRRIRKKLAEYYKCYCNSPKFKKAFLAFDTFNTPNSDETLRDKLNWLFLEYDGHFKYKTTTNPGRLVVMRKCHTTSGLIQFISFEGVIRQSQWIEKFNLSANSMEGKLIATLPFGNLRTIRQQVYGSDHATGTYMQEDGAMYEGELMKVGKNWIPMEGLSIYVLAGVTSNLFASLLSVLPPTYTIFATVRVETNVDRVQILKDLGITFITHEQALERQFSRILWLSSHDDVELLGKFAKTDTLAINSAAVMDLLMGKQDLATANAYQKSKFALFSVPNVYSLIPGFYIEDMPVPDWASKGLHGDTTAKLFDPNQLATGFDWTKAYSVTPKSFIVMCIKEWLVKPTIINKNSPVIVCTDRQYRRHELRRAANLAGEEGLLLLDHIYETFPHFQDIHITHESVVTACIKAAKFIAAKE